MKIKNSTETEKVGGGGEADKENCFTRFIVKNNKMTEVTFC